MDSHSTFPHSPSQEELYSHILLYLENHYRERLSVEQICADNLISRSSLQKLFQERAGCGVIEHFSRIKIDAAKQLIRSRQLNFSQIADYLGYSSLPYFSRQFKSISGLSPSAYATSVRSGISRSRRAFCAAKTKREA